MSDHSPEDRITHIDGVSRFCDTCDHEVWPCPTRILTDLIAELRAQHYADQCDCGCEQWYECKPCSHVGLCPSQEAAVRAEARLREVQGEW